MIRAIEPEIGQSVFTERLAHLDVDAHFVGELSGARIEKTGDAGFSEMLHRIRHLHPLAEFIHPKVP